LFLEYIYKLVDVENIQILIYAKYMAKIHMQNMLYMSQYIQFVCNI
jgi:hypothetical protein